MTYVIAQPCVDLKDRACVDECPVDCIYEGKRMLYIHPDECVDCGACEPVCPVEAIFYEDDTPEEWKEYYTANVSFFDDLGSPGGAAKMGEIDKDHPFIAELPPADPGVTSRVSSRLPDFPWDNLTAYAERARAHADGIVDLSIGTPVDPTPAVVQEALRAATDSPGYPFTIGRAETRQACIDWLARRHGVTGLGLDGVIPSIGSKELIAVAPDPPRARPGRPGRLPGAGLPDVRGRGGAGRRPRGRHRLADLPRPGDAGAGLAQLAVQPDRPGAAGRAPEEGRRLVPRARRPAGLRRVLPRVRLGGRAGLGAAPGRLRRQPRGDPRGPLAVEAVQPGRLPVRLRGRRPGGGRRAARRTQEPRPDDARRRSRPRWSPPSRTTPTWSSSTPGTPPGGPSCARRSRARASGSTTPRRRSTCGRPAARTAGRPSSWLADRGILVAPGAFYGVAGKEHVRIAFTATDERVDAAVARLAG